MALGDTIQTLATAPLFRLLEPEALRLIAFSAETRRLRPGETLFARGDRSDGGYVVIEGELDIRNAADASVERLGPGGLVGQTSLFVRTVRPSTVLARQETLVLRVSPTLMRRILDEFPDGARALQAALSEDLTSFQRDLDRVGQRLAAVDRPS